MSELFIVVEKDGLEAYQSIKEALTIYENLSEYVIQERKVFCLTYKVKKKKGEWEIEAVPLKAIAKAFLESVG